MRHIILTYTMLLCTFAAAEPMDQWSEYVSNPVYEVVPSRAYYPSILKESGLYTMWSDSGSGLQVATSSDGISWTTAGIATGLSNVAHSIVEKVGSSYRIWYWDTSQLYDINAMRTATSANSINWSNDQAITQVDGSIITGVSGDWNRGSYGPADICYNSAGSATITAPVDEASVWANKFVMYYDGTTGSNESLGLAVSNDGINWQGYDNGNDAVFAGTGMSSDWDEEYVSRATVLVFGADDYRMWYSGGNGVMNHGIGFATSLDGINWTRDTDPIFHIDDNESWRDVRTYTPMVVDDYMWFSGRDSNGSYTIGLAYAVPEPSTLGLVFIALVLYLSYRPLHRSP